ncbi:MAG: hypothetical protein HWD86_09370 [Kangiellaceae bacterium]|nr:hypothetical protein [Kangiellaceae bacterium]
MWTDFDQYVEELKSKQNLIPLQIYDLATNIERHELSNPSSLHDSWLDVYTVREIRNPERPFECKALIELRLLGQMHDRYISISYENVASHEFIGSTNGFNVTDTFHGDILKHAIIVLDEGMFRHKLEFRSGSKLSIDFKDLEITEEMI